MNFSHCLVGACILASLATGVSFAQADLSATLVRWQQEWVDGGVVETNLPASDSFSSEQLLASLAAKASNAYITGTDPMGLAFAFQALSQLLDGRSIDVVLLEALDSSDASVRAQAASGLNMMFERTRLVCAPDKAMPAGCTATGIYYTGSRNVYVINQLQQELQFHKQFNLTEFLRLSRSIRTVLEQTSMAPEALATALTKKMLTEKEASVRRGLAVTLGSYIASNPSDGVSLVASIIKENLALGKASIAESLVFGVAQIAPDEVAKGQAWYSMLNKLELKESLPALGILIGHPNFNVAWRSSEAAAWIAGNGGLTTPLINALQDKSATVRWGAAKTLATIAGGVPAAVTLQVREVYSNVATVIPELLKVLDDSEVSVRSLALEALEIWIDRGVTYPVAPFATLAKDATAPEDVRAKAARIVAKLQPEILAAIPEAASLQKLHQKVPLFKSKTEGYNTFRIPAIVRTTKGTLLAFAEGRRNSASDTGDIDVVLKRSTDQGETWSNLQIVWSDSINTSGNPTPVVDEDTGRIWLFMMHNHGLDTEAQINAGTSLGIRTVWSTYSDDDGVTWSKPRNMFAEVQDPGTRGDTMGPGIGIQLRHGPNKGRLVLPALGRIIYSDDHGQTWHQGGRATASNESQVVELSDGRLLRNDRPAGWPPAGAVGSRRALAISDNQGATWGAPRYPWELTTPYVQGSTIRLVPADSADPEKRTLIFSNPAAETSRHNMTVWVSQDDGATWPIRKQIHEGPAGYSCLIPLQDGTIGILYEGGNEWAYENLYWTRFSLDWLRDGVEASAMPQY